MKKNKKDLKEFVKGIGIRAFALFGLTLFSGLASGNATALIIKVAAINAGLYFFTELARYLGVSTKTGKSKNFKFLIYF